MGPFIDTSLLLLDPMFTDSFDRIQRTVTVNNFGEAVLVPVTTRDLLAVITPAKPADLRRLPENERGNRAITMFTQVLLNGVSIRKDGVQYEPDLVFWRSDLFIVRDLLPWTKYGPGWIKVVASSIDSVEANNYGLQRQ